MVGVFKTLDAVMMISRNRGIPSVTFAPDPARWNVFSVICVDGSPIDCAAIHPTASPGAHNDELYLAAINDDRSFSVIPVCESTDLIFLLFLIASDAACA